MLREFMVAVQRTIGVGQISNAGATKRSGRAGLIHFALPWHRRKQVH
jgi:hypothetical protein